MKLILSFLLALSFAIQLQAQNKNAAQNDSAKFARQAEEARRELIRLTMEISRASVEKDAATLERLMDEKFVLSSVGNKSYGKVELIKRWTAETQKPNCKESSVPSDFEVQLFGKTAIVVSTITDVECNGGERTVQTKAFDVWQKTKKGWRWIASRETLL